MCNVIIITVGESELELESESIEVWRFRIFIFITWNKEKKLKSIRWCEKGGVMSSGYLYRLGAERSENNVTEKA